MSTEPKCTCNITCETLDGTDALTKLIFGHVYQCDITPGNFLPGTIARIQSDAKRIAELEEKLAKPPGDLLNEMERIDVEYARNSLDLNKKSLVAIIDKHCPRPPPVEPEWPRVYRAAGAHETIWVFQSYTKGFYFANNSWSESNSSLMIMAIDRREELFGDAKTSWIKALNNHRKAAVERAEAEVVAAEKVWHDMPEGGSAPRYIEETITALTRILTARKALAKARAEVGAA